MKQDPELEHPQEEESKHKLPSEKEVLVKVPSPPPAPVIIDDEEIVIPDCQKPHSDGSMSDSEAESSVVEKVKLLPKALVN